MSPLATLLSILGVLGCLGFIAWRAKHAVTLFVIRIEGGKIAAVKGRLPRRLLDDIADVVERQHCRDLRIVCRMQDGQARLTLYGAATPGLDQVLRNLLGEYPVARLKQAPRTGRV
jgi:hypothetical protein